MSASRCALCAAVIGIFLNVVLAYGLSPFANADELTPPAGAKNLPFKSQVMHMLVHHKQVIFTSSLIVGVLVGLSCFLSCKYCKSK